MTKVLCNIYKSRRKEETYLFVSLKDDLSRVPDVLLETFGRPELKFAIADATKVLDSIEQKGFYLQLPPPKEEMGSGLDLFCKRDKDE